MVMGIADRKIRLQRRLNRQREPVIATKWHGRTSATVNNRCEYISSVTLKAGRALVGEGKDLVPVTEVHLARLAQDWIRVSQPRE